MRYFSEIITGSANKIVYGDGLTSIEAEPKTLRRVRVAVSAYQNTWIEGWFERERQFLAVDGVLSNRADPLKDFIPIDYEIPIGKTWKFALRCGGTAIVIYCMYGYEIPE